MDEPTKFGLTLTYSGAEDAAVANLAMRCDAMRCDEGD